jgi:hypothetical protein
MEIKIVDSKELSQEFVRAFCHASTIHITCDFCQREHFGRDGEFEEGELAELEAGAKEFPDKYIDHGYDMVSWINIDGKNGVVDCECGKLKQYEKWIWAHRYGIADYLRDRTKHELEEKQFEAERMNVKIGEENKARIENPAIRRRIAMREESERKPRSVAVGKGPA